MQNAVSRSLREESCIMNIRIRQSVALSPVELWARGYKTFFMLNSGEHEILNAHKYKNIKKFSFFQTQIS